MVGLALIVIALLGGGFEVKEIKLPVLGLFPRLLSFVTGTVLVSLYVLRPEILPPDGHAQTKTSQDPAPTATLSASTTSINAGQSSTLTWSSTNATHCSGTNFTPNATSGSVAVTPAATTIYLITCAGAGGVSRAASATVTVAALPLLRAPTATLSASLTSINAGQSSTLTWSSTNATGCRGTNFTPNATSGSVAVTPAVTTIYLITCAGAGDMSPAASVTVWVTAPVPPPGEIETLWRQNDSIMLLSTQGENIEIRYVDPTDLIKRTGVVSGDLKIKGEKSGNNYRGNGYIHTRYCHKGFAYEMTGSESADHKTIILPLWKNEWVAVAASK